MASFEIEAEPREEFGKGPNRRLRSEGKIPAVLYGDGKDAVALSVDPKEVTSIIRSHGGVNTIFTLSLKGSKGKENVMIKEYQLEPLEHRLLHADLMRVAMDKELALDVAVELTGTAVGVKTGGGTLDFITRSVEVACLPADIPETLVADITELDVGDYLRASDLELPEKVELVSEGHLVIAHILAPKSEASTEEEGEEGAEPAGEEEAPAETDEG